MFELTHPLALCLLPLPVIIRYLLPRATKHFATTIKVPFFNAINNMIVGDSLKMLHTFDAILFGLVWCLITFALAGPRFIGEPLPLTRESHNIMLALDISGSMALGDMEWRGRPATRLAVVKHAAAQFVEERTGDKIGLILFGSRAYLQTPLTYDRHNITLRLSDATVGLAGNSTSIGDALGLALKRLRHVPPKGRVIILLTDGANNSGVLAPEQAAKMARDNDIKIYTIGLGANMDSQTFGGLFMSIHRGAELDEATLRLIAKTTDGRYFRATDLPSLQKIYELINHLETVKQNGAIMRPQKEYYPWFVALALIIFLYGIIRNQA